jgi:AraC-like DNA-binding protein
MLIAKKELSAAPALFRFQVVFERKFRIYTVERRANAYDTRFVPGTDRMGGGSIALFVLLDGWIRWHDPSFEPLHGPAAFVSRVDHPTATASRISGGEPYLAIDLVFLDELETRYERPQRVELPAAVWSAARAVFDDDGTDRQALIRRFLAAIDAASIGLPALAPSIVSIEDEFVELVWSAFRELDLFATPFPAFQELVDKSGLSTSHFARRIKDLLVTFRCDWGGWRDLTNDARLRWAVMLISNPSFSIAEVARASGYGSTDALDAIFRRSGLPSPREVRQLIAAELPAGVGRRSVPTA